MMQALPVACLSSCVAGEAFVPLQLFLIGLRTVLAYVPGMLVNPVEASTTLG